MAKLRDANTAQERPRGPQGELDTVRRLEIYRREVKACREEANTEAEKDRELLTGLLRLWRSIKDLRRASRVHATSVRLLIRKEEVEQAEEEEKRKVELEEEVREVLEERQQEYEVLSKRYEKEIAAWKSEHKKRVSRRGRRRRIVWRIIWRRRRRR